MTNCIIIGRAEAYASKNPLKAAATDGFWMGMGMTGALVTLGAVREILGNGTLFDGAERLFGSWASLLRIEIFQFDSAFLLAILPPGAFITLGFLIALKNYLDSRKPVANADEQLTIRRVRINSADSA